MTEKELLRAFLVNGELNVVQSEHMKSVLLQACGMDLKNAKDRSVWSNWINAKCSPNRFCKHLINEALQSEGYSPIYKE